MSDPEKNPEPPPTPLLGTSLYTGGVLPAGAPEAEGDAVAALLRLTAKLNQTDVLSELCELAVEAATATLGAKGACILLCDREGQLGVHSARGVDEICQQALQSCLPPADVTRPVALFTDDVRADQRFAGLWTAIATPGFRSVAVLPLCYRAVYLGALVVLTECDGPIDQRGKTLSETVASHVAQAIARALSHESEQRARAAAERNADRVERLLRVSARLSSALTAPDVAEVVVQEGAEAIGAANGGVWLLDTDNQRLAMLRVRGYPEEMAKQFEFFPLEEDNPLCEAVRTGQPLWLDSWESYAKRYPSSAVRAEAYPRPPGFAFVCMPLRIGGRIVGGLAFTFFTKKGFDPDERAFVDLLGQHCAQGLDRARLYDRAVEAIQLRDDFLSVAGHELRTPLGAIVLTTDSLVWEAATRSDPTFSERTRRLQNAVKRLTRLTNELLDVARLRAGRLRLEHERVDLVALVRDVIAAQGPRDRPAVAFHAQGPVEGLWDRLRLEQVVTNLLTNALKYGGEETIEISVYREAELAILEVRDSGVGIPPEDQKRIFERFERARDDSQAMGFGLGLWIVRGIVEAHGGSIGVSSAIGKGSLFKVALPLGPAPDRGMFPGGRGL